MQKCKTQSKRAILNWQTHAQDARVRANNVETELPIKMNKFTAKFKIVRPEIITYEAIVSKTINFQILI
jgi:hypothetical protein